MALITPVPLEPAWENTLRRALARPVDDRALAVMVERLSRKYNGEEGVPLAHGDELAARALFWFARDVHKVALPALELHLVGALPDRPLRVLDVGAGTGATSLGLWRAAAHPAAAERGRKPFALGSVTALDADAQALGLLRKIADEARGAGLLPGPGPAIETRVLDVEGEGEGEGAIVGGGGPFDLVLAGSVLVELTRGAGDPEARGRAVAERAARWIERAPLAEDGALVLIEPATREETRALHYARQALLDRGYGVFAPCTHERDCPMLERERDWCHEDLPVDLPEWLVPVARAAGLRWQGLTFSYLVVRRDHTRSVREVLGDARDGFVPARLVSAPRATKGKTEVIASGDFPGPTRGPRLVQLEREVKKRVKAGAGAAGGVVLEECARGDVVGVKREAAQRAEEGRSVRVAPDELVKP